MQLINTEAMNSDKKENTVSHSAANRLSIEKHIAATMPAHPTSQLLLSSDFIPHHQDAGLNPLVDSAAKLFSVMGKLRCLKSYDELSDLKRELCEDIECFQKMIEALHYPKEYMLEYLPLATYTLCATFDDIISKMPWGNRGKWRKHQLLAAFNKEPLSNQNFLIILERLVRDPNVYIDMMEFMYICLSFGFRCHFSSSEGDQEQLQQITHSLYKRIRRYRGNFNKTLSPFHIKPKAHHHTFSFREVPIWLMIIFAIAILSLLVITGQYILNWSFNNTTHTFKHVERDFNEKHHE